MKRYLLATVAISALAATTSASAADLAARPYTKAPPMMVAMYDWSGFYIGLNGGGGYAHDHRFNAAGTNLGSYDAKGGTAGGQIGYRWQSGSWVWGLEAQGNWADFSGSTVNAANLANLVASKTDAFGLFTGQVGYAWNNVLVYAKGGAGVVDRSYEFRTLAGAAFAAPVAVGYNTQWGGTVGGGIEFGFAPNWSAGLEYNHIFLDRQSVTFANAAAVNNPYSTGGNVDILTAKINYKWGGPIIPKY